MYLTGESILINSFLYDYTSGIATITSNSSHGLSVDQDPFVWIERGSI